jgi:hypothetical protein
MDPKRYHNLYQATKLMSMSFNRFMSLLTGRLGFRPPYICILQPQNSGNPHLHVLIFGISWIEAHSLLTRIIERQGFGMIHHEYAIRRVRDRSGKWIWIWANLRKRPPDCKTKDVKLYLRTYLASALLNAISSSKRNFEGILTEFEEDDLERQLSYSVLEVFREKYGEEKFKKLLKVLGAYKVSFYFATNKRFFTCSRDLMPEPKKRSSFGLWELAGVWYWQDVPEWVQRMAGAVLVYSLENPDSEWELSYPILYPI